jgi:transglutaminase-like putative cysteine protease
MSSGAIQQIPAFINRTVDKAVECLSPQGRKLLIKVYINGASVEDAVKSTPEIDDLAIDLVDAENDRYVMAKTLYDWVCQNISYDSAKAAMLETDAFGVTSGANVAFETKTGVCFDKACLYTAMCRAVGVKVRLITGHAYNGADWMDHSWNQVYDERDGRWVNVDTTFWTQNSNYFDNPTFYDDHKDDELQGEW